MGRRPDARLLRPLPHLSSLPSHSAPREKEKAWSWAISALAQALQFWLCDRAIRAAFPNESDGILAAAFFIPAAIGFGALLKFYRRGSRDR